MADEAHGGGLEVARIDLGLTLRFDPLEGVIDLEAHLAELKAGAQALGIVVDRHALRNELHAATFRLTASSLVRVRVSPGGASAIEAASLPPPPAEPVMVAIRALPCDRSDPGLRSPAVACSALGNARDASGRWEVLFADPAGRLVGGSHSDLFVARGARLETPRDAAPAGLLRATLLASGEAEEAELVAADLAGGFYLGHPLHGLLEARLA